MYYLKILTKLYISALLSLAILLPCAFTAIAILDGEIHKKGFLLGLITVLQVGMFIGSLAAIIPITLWGLLATLISIRKKIFFYWYWILIGQLTWLIPYIIIQFLFGDTNAPTILPFGFVCAFFASTFFWFWEIKPRKNSLDKIGIIS